MKAFLISDNHDSLVGMRLAGIEGVIVHSAEAAYAALETLKPDTALLLVTENVAQMIPDAVRRMRENGDLPILVAIPDRFGTQRGKDFLMRYVQEAIGVSM